MRTFVVGRPVYIDGGSGGVGVEFLLLLLLSVAALAVIADEKVFVEGEIARPLPKDDAELLLKTTGCAGPVVFSFEVVAVAVAVAVEVVPAVYSSNNCRCDCGGCTDFDRGGGGCGSDDGT